VGVTETRRDDGRQPLAGFTRYIATGKARLIGRAVTVPVLRGDGSEIDALLRVQARPAAGGRTVFVAVLEPAGPPNQPDGKNPPNGR
jgi:hypothetical protein